MHHNLFLGIEIKIYMTLYTYMFNIVANTS